jgi:hypothetical protein
VIGKLISGGQTGADIAALDVALRHGFPHGGWCPKGRRSLDGPLPARYQLTETPSEGYLQRTKWNVRDSDGTVVFTLAPEATGGSLKTIGFATKLGKPSIHIARANAYGDEPVLAAMGKSLKSLTFEFGHSSGAQMLKSHYVGKLPKAEAKKIWALGPKDKPPGKHGVKKKPPK